MNRALSSTFDTPSFDARAFARGRARLPALASPMPGARALVIPHHWPAGHLIAGGLRDLAATRQIRRVILIGPDHAHAGSAPVAATSGNAWRTDFGAMAADAAAVDHLIATGLVNRDLQVIGGEHGVAGLVPAVRHYFPAATIVPLAVRNDPRQRDLDAVGEVLARLLADDNTVLILSVDFAHVESPAEARRNDRETIAALLALDVARIRAFGAEHLDGRGVMAVAMQALPRVGAVRFELRSRSDASVLPDVAGGPVTSYVVGYWR